MLCMGRPSGLRIFQRCAGRAPYNPSQLLQGARKLRGDHLLDVLQPARIFIEHKQSIWT